MNRIQQHTKVVLTVDVPEFGLIKGDIVVIEEIRQGEKGPDEFLIHVVNAVGETIAMFPVHPQQIRELRRDEILHIRSLQFPVLAEPINQYHP